MKDIGFYVVDNKKLDALSKKFPMLNYHITQSRVMVAKNQSKYKTFEPDISLVEDTGRVRVAHITLMIMKQMNRENALEEAVEMVIENKELKELQHLVLISILAFLPNTEAALRLTEKLFSNIDHKYRYIYLDNLLSYCYGNYTPQFILAYNSILFRYGFSNEFYRCFDCDYKFIDFYDEVTDPMNMKENYCKQEWTHDQRTADYILDVGMLFCHFNDMLTKITPVFILYEYQNITDICGTNPKIYKNLINNLKSKLPYIVNKDVDTYKKYMSKINLMNCSIIFNSNISEQSYQTQAIILKLMKEIIKYYCKNSGTNIKDVQSINYTIKNILFPYGEDTEYQMNNLFSEPIPDKFPFEVPFVIKNDEDEDDYFSLFNDYDDEDVDVTVSSVVITPANNYSLMYSEAETYR